MEENKKLENNDENVKKNSINWKAVGKKVLFGLSCAGMGILAFLAVGVAMVKAEEPDGASDGDGSSEDSDGDSCESDSADE